MKRTPISPAPTAAELEAGLVALRAMFDRCGRAATVTRGVNVATGMESTFCDKHDPEGDVQMALARELFIQRMERERR